MALNFYGYIKDLISDICQEVKSQINVGQDFLKELWHYMIFKDAVQSVFIIGFTQVWLGVVLPAVGTLLPSLFREH